VNRHLAYILYRRFSPHKVATQTRHEQDLRVRSQVGFSPPPLTSLKTADAVRLYFLSVTGILYPSLPTSAVPYSLRDFEAGLTRFTAGWFMPPVFPLPDS